VDYALDNVLLFRVEVCGEGFVELGLFLLEFYVLSARHSQWNQRETYSGGHFGRAGKVLSCQAESLGDSPLPTHRPSRLPDSGISEPGQC